MHKIVVTLVTILVTSISMVAHSEEIASSISLPKGASITETVPLTGVEFLKVLDPSNKRDPSWPDKLTFQMITSISQDDFDKRIQGRWRVSYHCDGHPVKPNDDFFDGVHGRKYLELGFKDKMQSRNEVEERGTSTSSRELTRAPYSLYSMGNGVFRMEARGFVIKFFHLMRINETGELAIFAEGDMPYACPDGSPLKTIYVPVEMPVG